MSIQLTANSFLQMLARSGLLTEDQMRTVEDQFGEATGPASAQQICDSLLAQELITPWHAEKLLQAKFRGFFLGPYKLLRRVARGGMSTIYAARHKQSGDIHALKVLPLTRANQASWLPRFQREAAMTQRLQHPNIVRVFGIFSDSDGQDDVHFMAMEMLDGRDLFEIVNSDGPLPCRLAAEYIRQAACALDYAHKAGLVHRDIKPGNLFLSDDGTIRILDLGLAQDFDSEENLTREFNERVLGTADYLAPEQAADSHTADGRADLYSLGCSLYFLLTGQPPFTEGTLIQRLLAHQKKTPPPISQFRGDVPDELISLLIDMMQKDRNQRISSAVEVVDRLSRFLNNSPNCSEPPQAPEKVPSQPDHSGSRSDESPPQEFLPEFSELLNRIETECGSSGSLSADPRSLALLTLARNLRKRTVPEFPSQDVAEREHPETVVQTYQPRSVGRSLIWVLALSCLIAMIYMVLEMSIPR